jgi:peptidyl-prolyl cis-trans isomerase C
VTAAARQPEREDLPMSACSVRAALPKGPRTPIKVNGVAISQALISREVQNHPAESPVAAWRKAALAVALREALTQEAARLGVEAEPVADGEGRRETPEEARLRALVEREVVVPEPTEEECRRYHARNARRFRSADLYEPAHILFPARRGDEEAFAAAREAAAAAKAAVEAEPKAFAALARAESACPSREVGGNLGQVGAGQTTPEFDAALRAMAPGDLALVETRYGVHLVRLDRKIEGRDLPFELVHGHISRYLAEAVRRRAEAQYVARLLAGAKIEGLEIPTPADLNVH